MRDDLLFERGEEEGYGLFDMDFNLMIFNYCDSLFILLFDLEIITS